MMPARKTSNAGDDWDCGFVGVGSTSGASLTGLGVGDGMSVRRGVGMGFATAAPIVVQIDQPSSEMTLTTPNASVRRIKRCRRVRL